MPDIEETPREREPRERKPRPIRLSRKLSKPDNHSIFAAREKSVLGPRMLMMSPWLLFTLNVLTLGLRSAFWLVNRMRSLTMMAKIEEKNIKKSVTVWIAAFCVHFTLMTIAAFHVIEHGVRTDYLTESSLIKTGAAVFVASLVINRFILFWSREVIIDELMTNELDVIRSRALTFAPSPMMIWFVGVPYIQAHINRMIKKKGLNAYKPSRGVRVRRASFGGEGA